MMASPWRSESAMTGWLFTTQTRLTILLTAIIALAGCDSGPSSNATAHKIYRHSLEGAPTSLDPAHAANSYANFVVINVYDTLYSYRYLARPYEIKPNLAVAMPQVSDDGLVYTISLKTDVRFIDDPAFADGRGRSLTAADVVYSLQRHFDPASRSQGAWLWRDRIVGLDDWAAQGSDYDVPVAGLKALDDHTVIIRLTRPYPQLTYTLAMGFSAIVPHEAVAHYGRELAVHPVGSGPFRAVSFDTAKAVLVANEQFRQEPLDLAEEGYDAVRHAGLGLEALAGRSPPYVEQAEVHFIQEDAVAWASFTKGDEIHHTGVPKDQVPLILSHYNPPTLKAEFAQRFQLHSGLEPGLVHFVFNMDDARVGYAESEVQNRRNRALRCAIRQAFDWPARNAAFFANLGTIYPGTIPPMVPEFDPTLSHASVTHDLAAAQATLREHGWTADNLPDLEYGLASGVTQQQGFEQFRGQMVALGFPPHKVGKRVFATFGDYSRAMKNRQVQFMLRSWTLDYPDAENTLQLFYGPNAAPGSNNANYNNPDYDALYLQASVLPPSPQRTAIYRRMNELLIEDCVTISALSRQRISLTHKNVIALPDGGILGGFFLKYVDLQ